MATIYHSIFNEKTILEVYKIEETDSFYKEKIDFTEFDRIEFEKISHPEKKSQWLASRYLLKRMSQEEKQLHLTKTASGKPNFSNHPLFFSISHSHNLVAVIISEKNNVAVDLEMKNEKLHLIKKKFLHTLDCTQGEDIDLLTILWSAKESIYKYCDNKLLSFKEHIAINSISNGFITASIESPFYSVKLNLQYKSIENYWITWIS